MKESCRCWYTYPQPCPVYTYLYKFTSHAHRCKILTSQTHGNTESEIREPSLLITTIKIRRPEYLRENDIVSGRRVMVRGASVETSFAKLPILPSF